MATLEDFLARILNPNPGMPVNRMVNPGGFQQAPYLPQTGLGPEELARFHQASGLGGAPQAAPPAGDAWAGMRETTPPVDPVRTASAAPVPSGGGGFLDRLFGGGGNSGENQTIKWLQDQGMDPGTATMIAKHKPSLQAFLLERAQGGDPMKAVELRKAQLELENLENPDPDYSFVTGRDGSIFRTEKSTGKMEQVYGGKPDQPTDVQEYEYAKGQGYQGTFQEFQIEQKRAGASQVNIDQKAEGAFDKKLAEKQAETFDAMSTEGMNAKADVAIIGELDGLLAGQGGMWSGLSGHMAKYGIGGEGISDIQAAQALINKLVPTQRQPGSGTMSDRDVELFTRSLPSLWNTPDGNRIILDTMKGLAQYKQAQGEIADMVLTGEVSRQEARRMLRELPNPLAEFRKDQSPITRGDVQDFYDSETPSPERFGDPGKGGRIVKRRLRFNPSTGQLE